MKRYILALIVILFSSCNRGPEKNAAAGHLPYVRGSFNDWDLSMPMQESNEGPFAVAKMLPGKYEFKLSDENWSAINLGVSEPAPFVLGARIDLVSPGQNIPLEIDSADSSYVFLLHNKDPEKLYLTVFKGSIQ